VEGLQGKYVAIKPAACQQAPLLGCEIFVAASCMNAAYGVVLWSVHAQLCLVVAFPRKIALSCNVAA
jgi:hypothetical protein